MVSVKQAVQRHRDAGRGVTARQTSNASCGTITVVDDGSDSPTPDPDPQPDPDPDPQPRRGLGAGATAALAIGAAGVVGLALRGNQ